MKQIKEKDSVHLEWYIDAQKQTLETLPDFIKHLLTDYGHDYGTICHALAAGSIATAYAMNESPQGGITGFQAGAVMWEFIRNWNYSSNKTGLRLIDYDHMLFPQYESKFEKTISKGTFEALQKEAARSLKENNKLTHGGVIDHWKSIVAGKVPFGYTLTED